MDLLVGPEPCSSSIMLLPHIAKKETRPEGEKQKAERARKQRKTVGVSE